MCTVLFLQRRHDVKLVFSEIVQNILDDMPSDITDLEDAVYSALLLGRPTQALADAGRLDIWLATHIADFLDALDLIEREPDEYVTRYCTLIATCLRSDVLVLISRCASSIRSPIQSTCTLTRACGGPLWITSILVVTLERKWQIKSLCVCR